MDSTTVTTAAAQSHIPTYRSPSSKARELVQMNLSQYKQLSPTVQTPDQPERPLLGRSQRTLLLAKMKSWNTEELANTSTSSIHELEHSNEKLDILVEEGLNARWTQR
eukprot:CAMPEP_0194049076 /NCGR_PEP_ID=MMETSP0009_2-20130614/29581_1 /TAXON_ID=210454 /ORGANISM="Grammatophora oceanica, Strain CCMP 410" /LENGTH=107 /DNA_ID=CAMNT_0038695141 /DNA_START=55 /DNA_END=378 /DNA_ORIENTATION=-